MTVYAYTGSGHRDSASDFDLDYNRQIPKIVSRMRTGDYMCLIWDDGKVYAYTSSGHRDSASDIRSG